MGEAKTALAALVEEAGRLQAQVTRGLKDWYVLLAHIAEVDPSWTEDMEEPDPHDPDFQETYDPWEGLRLVTEQIERLTRERDEERAKRKEAEAVQAAMGTLLASITDHGPLQRFGSNNPSRLLEWIILIRAEARALLNKLNVGEEAPRIQRIMDLARKVALVYHVCDEDCPVDCEELAEHEQAVSDLAAEFSKQVIEERKAIRGEEKP